MLHYIHHIIFDPLSAWDRFWADAFWAANILFGMAVLLFVVWCWIWVEERIKRDR